MCSKAAVNKGFHSTSLRQMHRHNKAVSNVKLCSLFKQNIKEDISATHAMDDGNYQRRFGKFLILQSSHFQKPDLTIGCEETSLLTS